jgi:glycosyltransferase involved in cell wall biosynthesis
LHLLLIGQLESQDAVVADTMAALQADSRVRFIGVDWDTPRLYAAMDVLALPTYREGFPNVALEASAMALPIVATSVPGCVDAIQDGTTGILVAPRDARALADALQRYLSDPRLRAKHGEAGRRRVLAEFRREAIWEAIAAEYRSLLELSPSTHAEKGPRPARGPS